MQIVHLRRGTADDAVRADAADQRGWFENRGGVAMLVKSLATVVLLIAGLWATFRPLHPTERYVDTQFALEAWYLRIGVFLTTLVLVIVVWTWR